MPIKVGTRFSAEWKNNISKGLRGHAVSEEAKRKMSEAAKGKYVGEKSVLWKGGSQNWAKRIVLMRDDYTCKKCGMKDLEIMEIDHIIPLRNGKRKRSGAEDLSNLQTLCPNCHRRKTLRDRVEFPMKPIK